ncbi:hypothetical protein D3C80_2012510 [compost metagenome]
MLLLCKFYFIGFDLGLISGQGCVYLQFAVTFTLQLVIQFLVLAVKGFERCFGQLYTDLTIFMLNLVVSFCFFGLVFQRTQVIGDLK